MLIINRHVNTYSYKFKTICNSIERVLCYKYLGVILDEKLAWLQNEYVGVMYKVKYYVE